MSNAFVNIINRGWSCLNLVFKEWMIRFPTETGGQSIKTMHNKWYHVLYESLQVIRAGERLSKQAPANGQHVRSTSEIYFQECSAKVKSGWGKKKKRVSLVSERNNNQQSYKDLWLISLCLLFFFFFLNLFRKKKNKDRKQIVIGSCWESSSPR